MKPKSIINKVQSKTLSSDKGTVHIIVTHTYFVIIIVSQMATLFTIKKKSVSVDSLVCCASTTAMHWKAIYYVESIFYSYKNYSQDSQG